MASATDRPNVVVFFTDQQRHDTTGLHGNPMGLTPNFDRLARRGTHVANCFTPNPVCGPARACLQTGTYNSRNGVWRNGINLPTDDELPNMASRFKEAGYATGLIGKWHLATDQRVEGTQAVREEGRGGYQYWLAANAIESNTDAYHCELFDNDNEPRKLPGYRVDAMTDAAIRFIDDKQDEPFFLFLSFLEPHHQNHVDDYPPPDGRRMTNAWVPPDLAALKTSPDPYMPEDADVGGSAMRHLGGYYGMVKRLDEALGRLHDALKSLGLDENTIVVFASDHACHFKTRNSEYKRSCHEASIRVPCCITGPGFEAGGQLPELVNLVDLAPTLMDACGVDIPETVQGRSLLPLLRRETAGWPEEVFVQISESHFGRAVRTRRWKYGPAPFQECPRR
ncbi:MAG: sulfatase-like hydrolase/transferase, partial [Planctomycetota bacterium]